MAYVPRHLKVGRVKMKMVPLAMVHGTKVHTAAGVLVGRAMGGHMIPLVKNADPFEVHKKAPSMSPGFDEAGARERFARKEANRKDNAARTKYARTLRSKADVRTHKPYTQPTPDQKLAQGSRRADQAVIRAAKPYIRHPTTPPKLISHFKAGPVSTVVLSGSLAAAAANAVHRNNKLAKSDSTRNKNTVLGGIAGLGAADAASMAGGQTAKATLKHKRAKVGVSAVDERVWTKHKAKYGVRGTTNKLTTDAQKYAIHRNYPKSLPGWRGQRILAVKNKPEVYGATLIGGAALGAHLARKHTVSKKLPGKVVAVRVGNSIKHGQGRDAIVRTTSTAVPATFVAVQYGKKKPVSKSAFGVEHGDISKASPFGAAKAVGSALRPVKEFGAGMKSGVAKPGIPPVRRPMPARRPMPGAPKATGARAAGAKVTGTIRANPGKSAAVGGIGAGGAAFGMSRKNKF